MEQLCGRKAVVGVESLQLWMSATIWVLSAAEREGMNIQPDILRLEKVTDDK